MAGNEDNILNIIPFNLIDLNLKQSDCVQSEI